MGLPRIEKVIVQYIPQSRRPGSGHGANRETAARQGEAAPRVGGAAWKLWFGDVGRGQEVDVGERVSPLPNLIPGFGPPVEDHSEVHRETAVPPLDRDGLVALRSFRLGIGFECEVDR